jgi:threonylcarbamoyladenosine tRNA methylthiotransferase MtaB
MKAAVYLSTLGCRLNEAELVSWSTAFAAKGHRLVSQAEDANLIVLNTCAVTAEASRKSRKHASALHRKSPSARLVVTGCMAELEPEKAAELSGVDLVLSNRQKDDLVDEILKAIDLEQMPKLAMAPESVHVYPDAGGNAANTSAGLVTLGKHAQQQTRAFIKVQDGCRNQCTYCVVTIARGEERSRGIEELVAEINTLHQRGYREAVLTGVHLGGYGHEIGTDLSTLVRAILKGTTIPRLRLSSLEPWDLPSDFGTLWEDQRLMPHLHLPLQSGSDSVLRRMARRCFRRDYRELVQSLRSHIPDLNLTTDLIVGFPGETEEEFAESLAFAEEMQFGHMHIFGYSAREGTKAAGLPGRVEGPVIRERSRQMHRLAARMKEERMRDFLGSKRSVLWEAGSPAPDGQVRFQGYTDNYLRVQTLVPSDQMLQRTITDAVLSELGKQAPDRFEALLA